MIAHFKFCFAAESVNNEFMALDIEIDKALQSVKVSENFIVDIDINLPADILFHLSKRKDNDTIVKDDKIVADKFIKLESLEIDGFFVHGWQLPDDKCLFETADNTVSTVYWARNGTARLIIDNDDPALWLLDCPKII